MSAWRTRFPCHVNAATNKDLEQIGPLFFSALRRQMNDSAGRGEEFPPQQKFLSRKRKWGTTQELGHSPQKVKEEGQGVQQICFCTLMMFSHDSP